ncbi:uncharacterized protein LOC112546868 isoform X1 [Pelodiscus sinensis]|uniref:uncharacterized protein LOC112546868 isoform X1 n=1 Tax=Pelodiscus sinensis TaxID=13735 RepID=UPI003F6A581E
MDFIAALWHYRSQGCSCNIHHWFVSHRGFIAGRIHLQAFAPSSRHAPALYLILTSPLVPALCFTPNLRLPGSDPCFRLLTTTLACPFTLAFGTWLQKMNSQYVRFEVFGCETEELTNFWEKTIEKQTQHLQIEKERQQRSALPKLRTEWKERLEKRIQMMKAQNEEPAS